jgi:hypothetical protein
MKASTYSALSYTSKGKEGEREEWQRKCKISFFVHQFLCFSTSIPVEKNALHFTHQKSSQRQLFEENKYENW